MLSIFVSIHPTFVGPQKFLVEDRAIFNLCFISILLGEWGVSFSAWFMKGALFEPKKIKLCYKLSFVKNKTRIMQKSREFSKHPF